MANLDDYRVTDGVDEMIAAQYNRVLDATFRGDMTNVEARSTTKTLVNSDFPYQEINPTSDIAVYLPAPGTANHPFQIINSGTTLKTLTVYQSGGAAIMVLPNTFGMIFNSDGTTYRALQNMHNVIVAQVGCATAQSVANTTYTDISNDTEYYDTDGFYGTASPTLLTIPYTGWYDIAARVTWQNNGTGFRASRILQGGAVLLEQKIPALSGDVTSYAFSIMERLTAGQTIKMDCYQNSGGTLTASTKVTVHFKGY